MHDVRVARTALAAMLVAVCLLLLPSAAHAQIGALSGRVVDEAGKPVAGATVTFDYQGEEKLQLTAKTNEKGEWVRAGLRAVGRWTITATKDNLGGRVSNIQAPLSTSSAIPDIVVRAGGVEPASAAEMTSRAQAEVAKIAKEADAAMAAGNYDLVISKYTEVLGKTTKCGGCYVRIGDAQLKKNDAAAAEKAYLQAVEADPASRDAADAYGALAALYNGQKKYDEATKMADKAKSIAPAGGGGDASSVFNAGAILFNQGKIAEAKVEFQRAIQLNPKLAEAHYSLAMCLVNENKMAEAKASLQEYLKLAPAGPNAATAKAILDTIK